MITLNNNWKSIDRREFPRISVDEKLENIKLDITEHDRDCNTFNISVFQEVSFYWEYEPWSHMPIYRTAFTASSRQTDSSLRLSKSRNELYQTAPYNIIISFSINAVTTSRRIKIAHSSTVAIIQYIEVGIYPHFIGALLQLANKVTAKASAHFQITRALEIQPRLTLILFKLLTLKRKEK